MRAERDRHLLVLALEVTDPDGYARYRAGMRPILAAHGGSFGYDLSVAEVLASPEGARPNRVFTMSFPDRSARERFFADERYRAVRAEHFEPAVASVTTLAEVDEPPRTLAPDG